MAAIVALGAAGGAYSRWAEGELIAPGVAIAGVPVGGLTRAQAEKALQKRFGRLFVSLETERRPFRVALKELGGAPSLGPTVRKAAQIGRDGDVFSNFLRVYGTKTSGQKFMLPVVWRKAALVAKLKTIDHLYKSPARDARLKIVGDDVRIVPDVAGRALNVGETALRIQKRYFIGAPRIEAATRTVAPKLTARDLEGQDVLLASYPTRFNGGLRGRTTNIRVACSVIDGRVLMPGETFSFNQMTGERTYDKGYRMAHIFERKPGQTESEVVDGLAGGVCQVSSTLYNAVRRANEDAARKLKIIERNSHSLPVTYVPSGLDATVAWPYKDFRFRNTLDHPVYLRTSVGRSRLVIGVWGRVPAHPMAAEAPEIG
jgi:vancomycin resistance protein YoaR